MNKMKLTTLFAAISLTAGLATAQPATPTPVASEVNPAVVTPAVTPAEDSEQPAAPGRRGDSARPGKEGARGAMGPFSKVGLAERLETLTAEQKASLKKFAEENKDDAQALQKEFRDTMDQARAATDKEARKAAMTGIREKFKGAEAKVDNFLKQTLTAEQQTELQQKATGLRDKAAARVRGARNGETTTTAATHQWNKDKKGKKGDAQAMDGKKGKKHNKNKKGKKAKAEDASAEMTPAASPVTGASVSDSATTGTVNPFTPANN